jgi:hypothetical protein
MSFRGVIVLLFLSVKLTAQTDFDPVVQNRIIELIEQSTQTDENATDFNALLETLSYYAKHPINLNLTNQEELAGLGILDDFEIQQLLAYKAELGQFVAINELLLAGLSAHKVILLGYFIKVGSTDLAFLSNSPKEIIKESDHFFLIRHQRVVEQQQGYQNGAYAGSPNKINIRYQGNYYQKLGVGFVLEKDEGEPFYAKNNRASILNPFKGFDYRNAYFSYKGEHFLQGLVVGSYSLQLGQGLSTWSGLALGKSAYSTQAKRTGILLRPYSSVNEFLYFNGIATQIKVGAYSVLAYVSHKNRDASLVVTDSLNYNLEAQSLPITGLHRTQTEIANKDKLKENIIGLRIGRTLKNLSISTQLQQLNYSEQLVARKSLSDLYDFSGKLVQNVGIDYKYRFQKIECFGENQFQSTGAQAHLVGGLFHLPQAVELISIFRHYTKDYFAPYANGFGENNQPKNETGLYLGLNLVPMKNWQLNAYLDNYRKPWLTFTTSAPSYGTDLQVQLNHQLNPNFGHYIRLKQENNFSDLSFEDTKTKVLSPKKQTRFRYHLDYQLAKNITLRSRIEFNQVSFNNKTDLGKMIYQDVKISVFRYKLDISTRIAFFDTPSFATSIYTYENDILYSYSVPAYFNKGTRSYLLLTYKLNNRITFYARVARWLYTDVGSISSGNSKILSDTKTDVKFQLILSI